MKVMLEAGLVSLDRDGTRKVYRLRPEGLAPLRRWVEDLWDTALDAYAAEAERIARDRAAPTPGWTEPDGA
jgi:DNA-binding PadR family transcriptional regulator